MLHFIREEAVRNLGNCIATAPAGFRYGFIEGIFHDDAYDRLVATYPPISTFGTINKPSGGGYKKFSGGPAYYVGEHRGCICHLQSTVHPLWRSVIAEFASPTFTALLSRITGIRCNTLCNFGFSYGKAGSSLTPHIDGAIRPGDQSPAHSTIAALLYCNPTPSTSGGTAIYAPDRTTEIFRVPHLRNGFLFFEQHLDAWHGFPELPPNTERFVVSVTYSVATPAIPLHTSWTHRLRCGRRYAPYLQHVARRLRSSALTPSRMREKQHPDGGGTDAASSPNPPPY